MLTINTNKHFDTELCKSLKEGTDAIFSGANVYNYIRFVQDGDVENIKVHIGQPEMGTRGFLHVHVTIQMEHNAKVQIDVKKLQEAYAEKLGFQPYVRFKLENNWRRYQMDYTDKSLTSTSRRRQRNSLLNTLRPTRPPITRAHIGNPTTASITLTTRSSRNFNRFRIKLPIAGIAHAPNSVAKATKLVRIRSSKLPPLRTTCTCFLRVRSIQSASAKPSCFNFGTRKFKEDRLWWVRSEN